MNNDRKTTILGWIKGAVVAVLTIFVADKVGEMGGAEQVGSLIAGAIGAVWAVVEVAMGIFTNKK